MNKITLIIFFLLLLPIVYAQSEDCRRLVNPDSGIVFDRDPTGRPITGDILPPVFIWETHPKPTPQRYIILNELFPGLEEDLAKYSTRPKYSEVLVNQQGQLERPTSYDSLGRPTMFREINEVHFYQADIAYSDPNRYADMNSYLVGSLSRAGDDVIIAYEIDPSLNKPFELYTKEGTVLYLHPDENGGVVVVQDENDHIINRFEYDPFNKPLADTPNIEKFIQKNVEDQVDQRRTCTEDTATNLGAIMQLALGMELTSLEANYLNDEKEPSTETSNIRNLIGKKCSDFNEMRTTCEDNSVIGVYCDIAEGVTEKVNKMLEEAKQMSIKCNDNAKKELFNSPSYNICGYGFNPYEHFETKPRTKDSAGFTETLEYLFDNAGCLDFVSSNSLPNIKTECCSILSNKATCLNNAELQKKQAYDYGRQNYVWQTIPTYDCPPMTACKSNSENTATCGY